MNTFDNELKKNGIQVVGPVDARSANEIAAYVARTLCYKFPELRLNVNTLFKSLTKVKMYIADMAGNMSGACYFYKNTSIYFQKGISLYNIKKLAVHECIHYLQEVKNAKGKLRRLGLCTFFGGRAYGNAFNEASVQLMSAYATGELKDTVTYYGLTLPTDSPGYYPLLCNLVKQIGYITGYGILFESTFYSNDAFYDKFKEVVGDANAYTIQKNFDKLLSLEEKIIKVNNRIQTEELTYYQFKNSTDKIAKCKNSIQKIFLETQNLIISSFFNSRIEKLQNPTQIETFRKYLYSFNNLIGTTNNYTFFNDYYIRKMAELDKIYENDTNKEVSMVPVKSSSFSKVFGFVKKLFTKPEVQVQTQGKYGNLYDQW